VEWKYVKSTKFTVSFVVGGVTALMMKRTKQSLMIICAVGFLHIKLPICRPRNLVVSTSVLLSPKPIFKLMCALLVVSDLFCQNLM
jgi:hypothetical protein